jgi:hypothetical protein
MKRKVKRVAFERLLHHKFQAPLAQLDKATLEFRVNTQGRNHRNKAHIFQKKLVDRLLAPHPSSAWRYRGLFKKRGQRGSGGGILFHSRPNRSRRLANKVNPENHPSENRPEKEIPKQAKHISKDVRRIARNLFFNRLRCRQERS